MCCEGSLRRIQPLLAFIVWRYARATGPGMGAEPSEVLHSIELGVLAVLGFLGARSLGPGFSAPGLTRKQQLLFAGPTSDAL